MSGWPLGSWLRQWLLWQQGLLLNFWFVFVVIIGILNNVIEILNTIIEMDERDLRKTAEGKGYKLKR